MTETAGIHFGPAWLRDTLVQPPHGLEPNSGGGSKMATNPNIMAPAKLAEFRYGREEMLALFTMPAEKALPVYQERVVANAGLLAEKPLWPMNLMGPMSEEEQRAWQKGANSDTSLRLYKKELPPGSMGGGPGLGRGAGGERGRGRGRGFFDRHRAPVDDEDPGRRGEESGRGFGRGGVRTYDRSLSDRGSWFDRSQQPGQPAEEGGPPNGNISPRKGYTRAPFDDWRKPSTGGDEQEQEGGGWRSGPSSSGRRWNAPPGGGEGGRGGWRTVSDDRRFNPNGAGGDREYQNGSSSRWHRESNDEPYNRRGGFSGGRPGFSRNRSRQDSDIPEWANEDISDAANLSGGFDASGKFSSGSEKPKRVINLNRDLRGNGEDVDKHEDEAFEDEEVDVDDLPENVVKEQQQSLNHKTNKEPPQQQQQPPVQQPPPPVVQNEPQPSVLENKIQDLHDQMTDDFVSKLIEEDEPHMKPELQVQPSPPQAAPKPPQALPPLKPEPGAEQIPSVQQIQWFYLDPQGNEQGPFTSSDMLEWYEARYFPADLMLRRAGIDRRFTPLNEISRLYGRVPFTPGPAPGPLLPEPQQPLSTPTPPPQQPSPSENSNQQAILQQMQQMQLQQQLLRQQQQLMALHQQPHLSELEKAQLINKIMQLSILPQQQQQQKPSSSSSAGDISMLLKQHEQQQQQQPQNHHHQQQQQHMHHQQQHQQQDNHQQPLMQQQQFGNFNIGMKPMEQQQQHQGMNPMMNSSSAESGLQLLGNLNGPGPNEDAPFNPIKSLLRQLQEQDQQQPDHQQSMHSPQQESHHSESPRNDQPRAPSNISGFMNQESPSPPPLQHQSPQAPRSIWGEQKAPTAAPKQPDHKSGLGVWGEETARESPNSFYNQVQQQREVGQVHPEAAASAIAPATPQDQEEDISGFVKPRASEKKDKKAKKAEEKKRAREKEAKRNATANDYIPGMTGSIRPSNDSEDENTQQRQYEEDVVEIEQQPEPVQSQPQQPQFQPKLAPWAKMSDSNSYNGNQSGLSLTEIQKLEEEREREAKMRREIQEAEQARIRQEEEARRPQNVGLNWANTVNSMDGGAQKSLAEIQAEEARQDRERQERERREKKARQKEMSLAQASVWGSASTNLSWANKASSVSNYQPQPPPQQPQPREPAPVQPSHSSSSIGFWDSNDPPPAPKQQQQQQQQQQSQNNNKKNKNKKIKEETKVAAIFKDKGGKPKNEFEEWCIAALEKLDPQVDIPTFLGFLIEVESPYEVNDYVKNYIGDGKGPKNFAKEYIERRSKWKNSLKSVRNNEDELLKPAAAINPNEPDEVVPVVGGGGAAGKKNKKKNKSKSKLDASHLLGFSVAAADRPNAGELDLPQ